MSKPRVNHNNSNILKRNENLIRKISEHTYSLIELSENKFKENKNAQQFYNKFYYYNGLVNYKQGLIENALKNFQKSNTYDAHDADTLFKLGLCFLKNNDPLKAQELISKAIHLKPEKSSWSKQLKQAERKIEKGHIGINGDNQRFLLTEKVNKKKMVLIPSDYNERVMIDIIPYIKMYKEYFDIYVILNNQNKILHQIDGYKIVKNETSLADYLKFTADYLIDAGSVDFRYKVSDKSKWISIWHGIPYKKMFIDLDIKNLAITLRYSRAYDTMISMSPYYTNFLKNSLLFSGKIIETKSPKIHYLNSNIKNKNAKELLIYTLPYQIQTAPQLDSYLSQIKKIVGNDIKINIRQSNQNQIFDNQPDINIVKDDLLIWKKIALSKFIINPSTELLEKIYAPNKKTFLLFSETETKQIIIKDNSINDFKEISNAEDLVYSDDEIEINYTNNCFKKFFNLPLDKKIILYAPTYREKGKFHIPFNSKRLQETLNNEYIVISKLHYLNQLVDIESQIFDFTEYPDLYDLFKVSDVLISDYSSLILDYATLNKPIILFQYDYIEYMSSRGVYFNLNDYISKDCIFYNEATMFNNIKNSLKSIYNHKNIINDFYPHQQNIITVFDQLNLDSSLRKTKDIIFLVNELNQIGGVHSFIYNMASYYKNKYNSKIYVLAINEFSKNNSEAHRIDNTNIDISISSELLKGACQNILKNTDGIVISLQFSAHIHFQEYLNGANSILMFHGDTKDMINKSLYKWHLQSLNSGNIKNFKKLIFLTKNNMEKILPYLNKDLKNKSLYIENSISSLFYNTKSQPNNFAYIGRLDKDKNALALIELARELKFKKSLNIVNVYGDGEFFSKIHQTIVNENLGKYIKLHGYVSDKDYIFSQNSCLILVSKSEGLPLVILEAYSKNKPVICFDSFTAAKEIVQHEKTGYLVSNDNFSEFVTYMDKVHLLNNKYIENLFTKFSNEYIFENKWNMLFAEFDIC